MRIEECHLVLQPVGIAAVVEILPGDVLAPGLGNPVVDRRGEPESARA